MMHREKKANYELTFLFSYAIIKKNKALCWLIRKPEGRNCTFVNFGLFIFLPVVRTTG